jgi:predicted restriction endonuclease
LSNEDRINMLVDKIISNYKSRNNILACDVVNKDASINFEIYTLNRVRKLIKTNKLSNGLELKNKLNVNMLGWELSKEVRLLNKIKILIENYKRGEVYDNSLLNKIKNKFLLGEFIYESVILLLNKEIPDWSKDIFLCSDLITTIINKYKDSGLPEYNDKDNRNNIWTFLKMVNNKKYEKMLCKLDVHFPNWRDNECLIKKPKVKSIKSKPKSKVVNVNQNKIMDNSSEEDYEFKNTYSFLVSKYGINLDNRDDDNLDDSDDDFDVEKERDEIMNLLKKNDFNYDKCSSELCEMDVIEKKSSGKMRVYQSKLRKYALNYYNFSCVVSGNKLLCCLEACHIKGVEFCDKKEKVDVNNIILLEKNLHACFDLYYWSIEPETMMVKVNKRIVGYEYLKKYQNMKLKLNAETIKYIKWHYDKYLENLK